MEQYDYRKTEKLEETVYAEFEALSPGQRMQVWESIQDVKRGAEADRLARGRQWFEKAVLPALRGFARAKMCIRDSDRGGTRMPRSMVPFCSFSSRSLVRPSTISTVTWASWCLPCRTPESAARYLWMRRFCSPCRRAWNCRQTSTASRGRCV